MKTETAVSGAARGGGFLLDAQEPESVFAPEDFSDGHEDIHRAVDSFWKQEVAPCLDAIQKQEPGVAVDVLRKSAELGLTAVTVPEAYGGMQLDLISAMIVAEVLGRDGSYAAWHGAHAGIGTLPVLLFGTADQKRKYLPKLASAEWVGAYCLTEPHAGSDALAAKTRADLSADGAYYSLSGQKMWITNAGSADLFTVFAKVGGEQFTAFLVERSWPGVEIGPEERKMGIKGSSTCPVYFNNVKVPAENVLGEIGRGHIIAFNILNLGRLKLGPFAVGAAKEVLGASLQYAGSRVAFGKPIAEFGLIQEKLAEMAIRIYAAESMVYRTAGAIAQQTPELDFDQPDAAVQELKVVEEFAIECSLVKVFASEMLDFVVDEGVQIHGGYGYHQDYAVERAYRDSRINRIFEGTNEINRLLATGMLLKRAQRKQLPLVEAVLELQSRVLNMKAEAGAPGGERLIAGARDTVLFLLGIAYERFGTAMDEQQEILAAIADAMIDLYTMQSVWLRTEKLKMRGRGAVAEKMTALYLRSAIERVTQAAYRVLGACTEGDTLRTHLAILRRFTRWEPVNGVKFRREIAGRLLEAGRYIV